MKLEQILSCPINVCAAIFTSCCVSLKIYTSALNVHRANKKMKYNLGENKIIRWQRMRQGKQDKVKNVAQENGFAV